MIRIAIIEDVLAIRRSITAFLNAEPDCEVVASCESVEEFLALDSAETKVDVILSDIGLPGMNGIEGIKLFKKKYPETEIIMLTVFQDEDHIYKARCAGASGAGQREQPHVLHGEQVDHGVEFHFAAQ